MKSLGEKMNIKEAFERVRDAAKGLFTAKEEPKEFVQDMDICSMYQIPAPNFEELQVKTRLNRSKSVNTNYINAFNHVIAKNGGKYGL